MGFDQAAKVGDMKSKPCVVVVLGAGRSGTSAITRGLQALGVELGDRLRGGGGKNPTGFFEDEDLLTLNKRLKRLLGIRGDSVALIEWQQWETPAVQTLKQETLDTIRRRFGRYALWGYKYGRTLRMLPFWEAVFQDLDLEVRYVVATRNPLSVARSRAKLDPRRGTQEKSDLEWLVNVVPYFRRVRERPFVVVDYDLIMTDPSGQLGRVATILNLPVTDETKGSVRAYAEEFLRPGMRHTSFTIEDLERDPHINALTRDAYRWLYLLATDKIAPNASELWQDWQRIEQAVVAMAPLLKHIDKAEADFRQAQWNPFSPVQAVLQLWRNVRST